MSYIMNLRKSVGSVPLVMVGSNVIVLDYNEQILLQLRSGNGHWGLPGGTLELGESLEDVAKRELHEETGLVAKRLTLFNVFSGEKFYYRYPNGDEVYHVITTYICTDYRGRLKKDEQEVKFFSLDDLPDNINPPEIEIINAFVESYSV